MTCSPSPGPARDWRKKPAERKKPQPRKQRKESPRPAEASPIRSPSAELTPGPDPSTVPIGPPTKKRRKALAQAATKVASARNTLQLDGQPAKASAAQPVASLDKTAANPLGTTTPAEMTTPSSAPPSRATTPAVHNQSQRESSIPSSYDEPPPIDPKWAAWFSKIYKQILDYAEGHELPTIWHDLLDAFIALESMYNFTESRPGLPATHRPAALADWIQNARKPVAQPVTTEGEGDWTEWSANFWLWWNSMQPVWRKVNEETEPLEDSKFREGLGSWDCMRKPGINGFATTPAVRSWRAAVTDVIWVLRQMTMAESQRDEDAATQTDQGDENEEDEEEEEAEDEHLATPSSE
ncbi:hypothetical protein HGRIS_001649 [Hohenbuehelia grisea]|uniref:Uncharacterized protein n=1 Tax=Hohenbuehelia grisea TaxID=104357 RepID=A0ABR3JIR4_9AGAR